MSDSFKKELLFDLGLLLLIAAVFLGGFAYFRLEFGTVRGETVGAVG